MLVTWCGPHNLPDLGNGVESPRPRVAGENRVMVWTTEGTARSGSWGVSTIEMAPDPPACPCGQSGEQAARRWAAGEGMWESLGDEGGEGGGDIVRSGA